MHLLMRHGQGQRYSDVSQVGKEVSKWKGGERVMALLAGGGYAEEVLIGPVIRVA